MTISDLMKMVESSLEGKKTLWEKEKLLVTSNFSFFHRVFRRLVLHYSIQVKTRVCLGKGYIDVGKHYLCCLVLSLFHIVRYYLLLNILMVHAILEETNTLLNALEDHTNAETQIFHFSDPSAFAI